MDAASNGAEAAFGDDGASYWASKSDVHEPFTLRSTWVRPKELVNQQLLGPSLIL